MSKWHHFNKQELIGGKLDICSKLNDMEGSCRFVLLLTGICVTNVDFESRPTTVQEK